MRSKVSGTIALMGICALGVVVTTAPSAGAVGGPTVTPVMGHLDSPRGIAFDAQGSMYLSESGVVGEGLAGTTQSGKVSKFAWGSHAPAWTHTFTSFYATVDGAASADVLGPEGISAIGNGCMKKSVGQRNGCQVALIMSESTPGIAEASGGAISDPQAGHLYRLDGATGAIRRSVDFGSQMYAWTGANKDLFPSDFPDSNPYGVLVTKTPGSDTVRTFVADAGANTISEVMADGTARIVAYIPNEAGPPFRDATPTCITQGPDGWLYVGTLHFVANLFVPPGTGGQSDVWRINPDANYPAAPQLWASGLTTVTACTFDRSGNFWAAEMFGGGFAAQPFPGDVVRMPFADPTQQTRVGVPVPGGIAQGPDGAMYVTVGSAAGPGQGGVFKIS